MFLIKCLLSRNRILTLKWVSLLYLVQEKLPLLSPSVVVIMVSSCIVKSSWQGRMCNYNRCQRYCHCQSLVKTAAAKRSMSLTYQKSEIYIWLIVYMTYSISNNVKRGISMFMIKWPSEAMCKHSVTVRIVGLSMTNRLHIVNPIGGPERRFKNVFIWNNDTPYMQGLLTDFIWVNLALRLPLHNLSGSISTKASPMSALCPTLISVSMGDAFRHFQFILQKQKWLNLHVYISQWSINCQL